MSTRTKERTNEFTIDKAEVLSLQAAAKRVVEKSIDFHQRHGVEMGLSPQEMYNHQILLMANGQSEYSEFLVDELGRIQNELTFRFHYKDGSGNRRRFG